MTINGVHTVNPRQTIHFQLLFAAYLHGPYPSCNCGEACNTCDPVVYSTCGLLRRASETRIVTEYFLSEPARRWKPFTDTVCDTSQCLSCPDYSWCHRLREIYDEGGVML